MLILDSQLVVLLVVGLVSKTIIPKHKNLTAYTPSDYDLLRAILGADPGILLLPNIVTESSSLLRQHRDPERRRLMAKLRELIASSEERYVPSARAAAQADYMRLGITDSAILVGGAPDLRLLTADLDLFVAAETSGLRAINFNHHRESFGM